MNVACLICSDQLMPSSEIYVTQCGHMFHYPCLIQWIERSRTCPQCRNKATEKTIHRIYFNVSNTDHIVDDVVTLQNKLDNTQFQLTLKEKDLKIAHDKYGKAKNQNIGLKAEVANLENKLRVDESTKHALKEQIAFFKNKVKENDRLCEEVVRLKNRLKDVESIQMALNGTREEVNDMLRNEHNIESLAILAATLKKTLIDAEKKKRDVEYKLKHAQNEIATHRREMATLEQINRDLKRELEASKSSWGQEKLALKSKVLELNKLSESSPNTSTKRIMDESPVPVSKRRQLDGSSDTIDLTASPSVNQRVAQILNSDSPYLPVKSSNVGLNYSSALSTKFVKTGDDKLSIFRAPTQKLENMKQSRREDVTYNGLGGHSKIDVFPLPRPPPTGLRRRSKPTTSVSSMKFKKLTPGLTFEKRVQD